MKAARWEKYLSVIFQDDARWNLHYEYRLAKANKALHALTNAGLLGGKHDIDRSVTLATAKIWPVIEYGRVAADYHSPDNKAHRQAVARFKMKVMKECLNVSQHCASDGVLGEVGMIPDAGSADRQHLQLLRRFMSAPEDSIPGRFAAAGMSFDSKSSFFTQGKALMAALGIKQSDMRGKIAKGLINNKVHEYQQQRWQKRIQDQQHLTNSFTDSDRLKMQPYLRMGSFRGRTVLTKLRLDDLPLRAASFNSGNPRVCELCKEDAETRVHFVLECPSLAQVRESHAQLATKLNLTPEATTTQRMQRILLTGTHTLHEAQLRQRAHAVGNLLYDLWRNRQRQMGLPQTFYP